MSRFSKAVIPLLFALAAVPALGQESKCVEQPHSRSESHQIIVSFAQEHHMTFDEFMRFIGSDTGPADESNMMAYMQAASDCGATQYSYLQAVFNMGVFMKRRP